MQPDPDFSTHPTPPPSERSTNPGDRNRGAPTDVHAIIQQWVAYHGGRRLGFGWSKLQLIREYLRRGIPDEELLVLCVQHEDG